MKFSERWLREWVNPPVDGAALCDKLTMSGLEVEQISPAGADVSGVVVAEVGEVGGHPDAGKLRVCRLSTGSGTPLTVVTGAADVRKGQRVPLAIAGAVLGDGRRVEKAVIRGVESHGMLCSAADLGMADGGAADTPLALPSDAPLGAGVRDYLQLDDACIEIKLQPPVHDGRLSITLAASAACPRYAGRIIRGVNARAAPPLWLRERLRRSGLRSVNAVVDITNYVMLELGQPMHAFDLARLKGGVTVRFARAGEQLELLDGRRVTLDAETLVIADDEKPLAMAGIMGGRAAAVVDATGDLFLGSAFFTPAAIAGRPWRYKLHTDSAHRFERGVDFELPVQAMERATELILQICGGRPGPVSDVADRRHLPLRAPVRLRRKRIEAVLGYDCAPEEVTRVLKALGMIVEPAADGWRVSPPSYRFDIGIEEDLMEEVARILGYDRVPSRAPGGRLNMGLMPEGGGDPLLRLRQTLI